MKSSLAIESSSLVSENMIREKLGLTCRSLDNNNSKPEVCSSSMTPTSRCLFGIPDPELATQLVRQIELKNALSFGNRFNFDVMQGQPWMPSRMNHEPFLNTVPDSDDENVDLDTYIWSEGYDDDYMTKCNKHPYEEIIRRRGATTVALLFAPIIGNQNHHRHFDTDCKTSSTSQPSTSTSSLTSGRPSQLQKPLASKNDTHQQRRSRRAKSKSPKRYSLIQHIITKYTYTNRVVKHARKSRKSIITGPTQHSSLSLQVP